MPRTTRVDIANEIYHVINRANARVPIFNTYADYQLFEEVLTEAQEKTSVRIYAYCIMPNHWHLLVSPKDDGDLSKFCGWLTMTHTQRWHAMHKTVGTGHLYQGRYKAFLVQSNQYLLQVARYIERNPVRAKLVIRAEEWQWSSLWRREKGAPDKKKLLSEIPFEMPSQYLDWVNETETEENLAVIRNAVNKGKPYGFDTWVENMIDKFELVSTTRSQGRPKKGS
jgi:putative transposase